MKKYTNETMLEIHKDFTKKYKNEQIIKLEVLNPDLKENSYVGEKVLVNNIEYIYRGFKSWVDLASKFNYKLLTPKIKDEFHIILQFKKLNEENSFHNTLNNENEKYGENSSFFKINKNEESEFLSSFYEALKNSNIQKRKRILNLGVNSGSEFELIKSICEDFSSFELVGIDYCSSAIKHAKDKFKEDENIIFYEHDINKLDELNLEEFDLIISIGTLQSSNLNFKKTFMDIVQKYLKKDGSIILGFPNCRWIDSEIIYGASPKNYNFAEMSVLINDAFFCKKYLQQKKFRVILTGQYYMFLTGVSIRK